MKLVLVVFAAFALGACSTADQDRAHADAEKAKEQSRELARRAEADVKKASHEVDRGLEKTRDKVRRALDDTDRRDPGTPDHR